MTLRITILSGTNRADSATRALAGHVAGLYRVAGADATLLDLATLGPEWFTPAAYAGRNDTTRPEARAVLDADGLVVLTPEYNGSFPGALKLFLDLLPFPAALAGRPVAFIGLAAGNWGGLRAVEQLQAIFAYRNAHLFPGRVFIPSSNDNLAKGQPAPDYAARLMQQTTDFLAYVRRFNATA
jgi:chromate reductase, NAD(P)H dehydrogenase (quinone)